jgi:hypothetical protein
MPSNPSLKQLAAEVTQSANTIVSFLESPDNAFTANNFAGHLGEPLEIQGARIGLLSHLRHLTSLLLAPSELAVFAPMMVCTVLGETIFKGKINIHKCLGS